MIEIAMDADGTEDRVRFAGGAMHVEAAGDQAVDYVLDLGVGGAFLHYDDHSGAGFLSIRVRFYPRNAALKGRRYNLQIKSSLRKAAATKSKSGLHIACYDFSSLSTTSPECMASRSALRASSMMRSKRRRIAASVSGPGLTRSAFSRTSRSRSG